MAEMTSDNASGGAGIDLSQFYQVFFEEAGENLQRMEQLLIELDVAAADDESLNAIFRCAHSIKGGAATFGFSDVAELTHEMETLLDKLRRHELMPTARMVDVLLSSGDALRAQLGRHQGSGGEVVDTSELLTHIRALASGELAVSPLVQPTPVATARASIVAAAPAAAPAGAVGERVLELRVGPLADTTLADNLVDLFKEITDLGQIEPLDMGQAVDGMRRFKVTTRSSDADLLDLFTFHVSREQVQLLPFGPGYGFHAGSPGVPDESEWPQEPAAAAPVPEVDPGYGFFDDAPGAPGTASNHTHAADAAGAGASSNPAQPPAAAPARDNPPPAGGGARPAARADKPATASLDAQTLRVSVEKVDQLINLVGELVITQAMLAQNSRDIDPVLFQQLVAGLNDLDRNTRDLQEAVMSIRMIPMSTVFSRFPRMLRDLAGKLGKKVDL
ncbi:MAG: hypothetical protein RL375_2087, partial [Pseudomonadota bacterium]